MTTPAAEVVPPVGPAVTAASAGGRTRDVLALKAVEYAGLAAFTVVVPRLMGPERYGTFAAVLGMVGLLTMLAGIGAQATLGRFVPEYAESGRPARVRQLFMQILIARLGAALLLSLTLVLGLRRLLPEATLTVALLAATTVLTGSVSLACYQLFYGLNRVRQWLVRDALVRPVIVALMVAWGGFAALDRAVAALLVAEAVFLLLGFFWARGFLTFERWEGGGQAFSEHLRFGLYFFAANLLLMAVWRGGEVTVVAFSTERAQVGFFNIANAVGMAFGALIGQLAAMLVPSIASLHVAGDRDRVDAWLGYSLKYLTIATFAFVLVVDAVGDWGVGLLLGEAYRPVVPNLKVLMIGLLPLALVRTAVNQAILDKRPARAAVVAGAGLLTFVGLAALLVPPLGGLGASFSVAGAVAAAGLVAYRQFALGRVMDVARFWRVVLPGVPALALTALPGLPAVLTALAALVLYGLLLWWARALTADELGRVIRAVRGRR